MLRKPLTGGGDSMRESPPIPAAELGRLLHDPVPLIGVDVLADVDGWSRVSASRAILRAFAHHDWVADKITQECDAVASAIAMNAAQKRGADVPELCVSFTDGKFTHTRSLVEAMRILSRHADYRSSVLRPFSPDMMDVLMDHTRLVHRTFLYSSWWFQDDAGTENGPIETAPDFSVGRMHEDVCRDGRPLSLWPLSVVSSFHDRGIMGPTDTPLTIGDREYPVYRNGPSATQLRDALEP